MSALEKIDDRAADLPLMDLAVDADAPFAERVEAVRALGEAKVAGAIASLLVVSHDDHRFIWLTALEALIAIGDPIAIPAIREKYANLSTKSDADWRWDKQTLEDGLEKLQRRGHDLG